MSVETNADAYMHPEPGYFTFKRITFDPNNNKYFTTFGESQHRYTNKSPYQIVNEWNEQTEDGLFYKVKTHIYIVIAVNDDRK